MTTTDRRPAPRPSAMLAWIASGSVLSVLGIWMTLAGTVAPSAGAAGDPAEAVVDLPALPEVLEVDTTLPERPRPAPVDALTSASRR